MSCIVAIFSQMFLCRFLRSKEKLFFSQHFSIRLEWKEKTILSYHNWVTRYWKFDNCIVLKYKKLHPQKFRNLFLSKKKRIDIIPKPFK